MTARDMLLGPRVPIVSHKRRFCGKLSDMLCSLCGSDRGHLRRRSGRAPLKAAVAWGVEGVAEAVAEEVDAEHGEGDGEAGPDHAVRGEGEEGDAVVQQPGPRWGSRRGSRGRGSSGALSVMIAAAMSRVGGDHDGASARWGTRGG